MWPTGGRGLCFRSGSARCGTNRRQIAEYSSQAEINPGVTDYRRKTAQRNDKLTQTHIKKDSFLSRSARIAHAHDLIRAFSRDCDAKVGGRKKKDRTRRLFHSENHPAYTLGG